MRTRLASVLRRAADRLSPPPKATVRVFVDGNLLPATAASTASSVARRLW